MILQRNISTAAELRIDLSAIDANYRFLRSLVGPGTEIASVVKSDAYGLGIDRIMPTLLDAGCRRFFVADLREAIRARRNLANVAHIYILSPVHADEFDVCLERRVTPVCHSLAEAVESSRRLPEFVLEIDTGFSRSGLTLSDVRTLVHLSQRRPDMLISHLACADVQADATNRLQHDRFVAMCHVTQPIRRSLAASAALWLPPSFHFDVVRAGSALYGINNAGIVPSPVLPVVQLNARLIDIRTVHEGEAVGYAASFRASRSMRIGIVALGYAAGLPWSAGNSILVAIGSHLAPVIGRVAMEYVAIDLGTVPDALCTPGQIVEFLGLSRSLEEMAAASRTIPQELLLRFGSCCHRNYTRFATTMRDEVDK